MQCVCVCVCVCVCIIDFFPDRSAVIITIHTIAPVYMSPENTHKLMEIYMEVLILGVIL